MNSFSEIAKLSQQPLHSQQFKTSINSVIPQELFIQILLRKCFEL